MLAFGLGQGALAGICTAAALHAVRARGNGEAYWARYARAKHHFEPAMVQVGEAPALAGVRVVLKGQLAFFSALRIKRMQSELHSIMPSEKVRFYHIVCGFFLSLIFFLVSFWFFFGLLEFRHRWSSIWQVSLLLTSPQRSNLRRFYASCKKTAMRWSLETHASKLLTPSHHLIPRKNWRYRQRASKT